MSPHGSPVVSRERLPERGPSEPLLAQQPIGDVGKIKHRACGQIAVIRRTDLAAHKRQEVHGQRIAHVVQVEVDSADHLLPFLICLNSALASVRWYSPSFMRYVEASDMPMASAISCSE